MSFLGFLVAEICSDNHQHCNATGSYSSFAGNDPNTSFGDLIAAKNITINGTFGQDLSVSRITNLEEVVPSA